VGKAPVNLLVLERGQDNDEGCAKTLAPVSGRHQLLYCDFSDGNRSAERMKAHIHNHGIKGSDYSYD